MDGTIAIASLGRSSGTPRRHANRVLQPDINGCIPREYENEGREYDNNEECEYENEGRDYAPVFGHTEASYTRTEAFYTRT